MSKATNLAPAVHATLREKERLHRLHRARTDLWFLCELLDMHYLDKTYHGAMAAKWDRQRKLRMAGK